jgi:hypothetical protein
MSLTYGLVQYGAALHVLAISTDPWRRRLCFAVMELLHIQEGEEIPPDLRQAHADLIHRATRYKEGVSLEHSIEKMDESDGLQMMKDISAMHSDIKRVMESDRLA